MGALTANLCAAAQPLKVARCTKSPVSSSTVLSAKPADKWPVNPANRGHTCGPVFNYLALTPGERSASLPSTAAHPPAGHCCPATSNLSQHASVRSSGTFPQRHSFVSPTWTVFTDVQQHALTSSMSMHTAFSEAPSGTFCAHHNDSIGLRKRARGRAHPTEARIPSDTPRPSAPETERHRSSPGLILSPCRV